jgi:hypothetical protein
MSGATPKRLVFQLTNSRTVQAAFLAVFVGLLVAASPAAAAFTSGAGSSSGAAVSSAAPLLGHSAAVTSPTAPPPAPRSADAAAATPLPTPSIANSLAFPSNFHLPTVLPSGIRPASWGDAGLPPGEILPGSGALTASGWGGGNWSSNSSEVKFCDGIWPDNGQAGYQDGTSCYGHDEPGADFYSPTPGSGGNITWNDTLPVDRSPTQNQSSLYSAVWFGMSLTDPYAWMDSCYLELQFYPDSGWYAPGPTDKNDTVNGNWVAEAVAWQIELKTGLEDPCFISPMYENGNYGPDFFNMTQGDRIQIKLVGWAGDPNAEQITINDLTSGATTTVSLENRTGDYANEYNQNNDYILGSPNYPLDPSYYANNIENALSWTPGGELPVAFSFEIGHAANPTVPETNPYDGCSPGIPPNNPSTPCPSYDPGSWVNDTLHPWLISTPTFSNSTTTTTPTQVDFSQDLGGPGFIDNNSGNAVTTACIGHLPSGWCDYPWYSYSCSEGGFNYGATDWPATTVDFGQNGEFDEHTVTDSAGLTFYAPNNFSIPTCSAPSYAVTLGTTGGGSVYFLNRSIATTTVVPGLGEGDYSLHALPPLGQVFVNWSATGAVGVGNTNTSYTWLNVSGTGTVTANFAASTPGATITFETSTPTGSIEVVSGPLFADTVGSSQAKGTQLTLNSGLYSILAIPPSGYNFTSWTLSASATTITSPTLPYSTLIVSNLHGDATLTANFQATTLTSYLLFETYIGEGTVQLVGYTGAVLTDTLDLPLGGYNIVATPAMGYEFAGWAYTQSLEIEDTLNPSEHFALQDVESGFAAEIGAEFAPAVTIDDAPAALGSVALASLGLAPAATGTTYYLSPATYVLAAAPNAGDTFDDWTVSSATALWAEEAGSAITDLVVNESGTVTAHFGSAVSTTQLWLNDTPSAAGVILFNYVAYTNGQSNASVGNGLFTIFVGYYPGYTFTGWVVTGDVSFVGPDVVEISPSLGYATITAQFTAGPLPVTFIGWGSATISTHVVPPGENANVDPGTYVLTLSLPTNTTFGGWTTQGRITLGSLSDPSTSITVAGPGVVEAFETIPAFAIGTVSVTPVSPLTQGATFDVGVPVVSGPGPFTYDWTFPTGWCTPTTSVPLVCTAKTTGSYSIGVSVTDATGRVLVAPLTPLTVISPFSLVGLTASPSKVTLGAQLVLSVQSAGGVGPYTAVYTGVPGCTGSGTETMTCTPTTPGTFQANVTVTDVDAQVASTSTMVTVNPALVVAAFVATPTVLTLGVIVDLNATLQGGTQPYTLSYTGLPSGPGCTSANTTSISCLPVAAGTYNVTVVVHDNGGAMPVQKSVTIVVNIDPAVRSFVASPTSVAPGAAVTFSVVAAGGTAPYTYSYVGLPSDCASQDVANLTCTSQIPGTYTVTVTITDADGKVATDTATFTVGAAPSNNSGSGGGLSGLDWVLIAVVLLVIVVLAAVILMRRPPREDAPAGPTEPATDSAVTTPASTTPRTPGPVGGPEDSYIYGEEPPGST